MNAAHWHLILNHIPVLGTFFAAGLLVAGIFGHSRQIKRSGLVFLLVATVSVIPTVITGEGAEEIMEGRGISDEIIHNHEEEAEVAQWLMLMLGVVTLGALLADHKRLSFTNVLIFICLLGAVAIGIVMINVATSGGMISHPEIHTHNLRK
jgi:hypothetical protein